MTARSDPRAARLRMRRSPIPATVAIEMRATPAATGALKTESPTTAAISTSHASAKCM